MFMVLLVFTGVMSVIGASVALLGAVLAESAPQQAAAATLGLALAVIPYVLMRCVQIAGDAERRVKEQAELLAALRALRKSLEAGKPTQRAMNAPAAASRRDDARDSAWADSVPLP